MAQLGNLIVTGVVKILSKLYVSDSVTAPTFIGNLQGSADTAARAIAVKDSANGKDIAITYGKSGQASTSWLASWNGQELGCISPSNVSVGKVNGHTVNSDVPANAKFTDTNTLRGVQDNLTSTATDQSLSANQGKVLKGLVDGKAASNHTHSYPGGFAGTDSMGWGVQTGGVVCGWADGAGGVNRLPKELPCKWAG